MDGGEEVARGFVVACGDGPELLELGEEGLDQMPCLVEVSIVAAVNPTVVPGRDDHGLAGSDEWIDDPVVGVERLVSDQGLGLQRWQELIGPRQIMRPTAGQAEPDRVAQRIDQGMDLGAQPAPRATDRLVLAGFFWAPALC
jgi:hypothetical protein